MTTPLHREPSSFDGTDPHPPPEKRTDPWAIALGLLGGVLLGTGLTFAILGFVGVFEEPTPPTIPPAPTLTAPNPTAPPAAFGDEISVASVAARVIPSTVAVEVSSLLLGGSGSGVIYGESGYIITNHHVIDGAGEVAVVFADGARFPADIIGSDPVTDIAVLRVQRQDLAPIAIGNADGLSIGDPAVAVGNPLGLEGGPTVTTGVVSALDRQLEVTAGETLFGLVQTDAPIAPGSSGGALVDAAGRLIGITTAIAVSNVGPEGLGFAVPVDIAVSVANDLIDEGEVRHARIGIVGATAWADEGGAEFPVGVLIEEITAGSAYEEAGGQLNDVVVAIDGSEVHTIDGLLSRLRRYRAGETIPVRILRGDGETTLEVTMGLLTP
ncbi:MAG TPA: trypsin-like peptidase domain-containing protein [Acidimicrobiia bacterium]|nr:trypsin-like peptidase domain-containing protein [Acidimicrobiia bacterium]